MDNDILREAVELAEGWRINNEGNIDAPCVARCSIKHPLKPVLAALASQLISQVDATEWDAIVWRTSTGIYDRLLESQVVIRGPNRDENSIMACVEFLRGLNDG